ncbi:hypothetical protein TNCV_750901 [Trichonephila clavipes]|nr:hypothetical protein TNCV_750901 [Trichonephila clavipes]
MSTPRVILPQPKPTGDYGVKRYQGRSPHYRLQPVGAPSGVQPHQDKKYSPYLKYKSCIHLYTKYNILKTWPDNSRAGKSDHQKNRLAQLSFWNEQRLIIFMVITSGECSSEKRIEELQCDQRDVSTLRWYWARTCDKASHDPIPIPPGYHGHIWMVEGLTYGLQQIATDLRSSIIIRFCFSKDDLSVLV